MNELAPEDFGPVIAGCIDLDHRSPLGPGRPRQDSRPSLATLTVDKAFGHVQVADDDMARCCLSGLWLHHDFLDESHDYSQEIHSSSGSYWHGIMHRREQDYSNAKYWFRKVGDHPVYENLASRIASSEIGGSSIAAKTGFDAGGAWDPFQFVDLCQQAARSGGDQPDSLETYCQELAWLEWQELFRFCYDRAVG